MRPPPRAVLIDAVRRRQRPYRSSHPLAIPRTALALDLIRSYGAVRGDELLRAPTASREALCAFHEREYVAAIEAAEHAGRLRDGDRAQFGLGNLENPYFDQLYTIPATATGGSLLAAEQVIAGRVAFNPAGGMHHARPGKAQGFCYFNDTALAVISLRRAGLRVLYLDIDAHHGDGVEEAFLDDPEVLTLSLHMDTRYAYPYRGGTVDDCGTARGAWTTINLPLPQGTHDAEYALVFDAVWARVLDRFRPDAIVLQAGADALAADPLGRLALTTQGYLAIVARVRATAPCHGDGTPRLLVTGGGGYHPLLVARAWTGLWGLLCGRDLAETIPEVGRAALAAVGWDRDQDEPHFPRLLSHRLDAPQALAIRDEIRRLADRVVTHPCLRGH